MVALQRLALMAASGAEAAFASVLLRRRTTMSRLRVRACSWLKKRKLAMNTSLFTPATLLL
jgi:hypothetical protein